MTATATATALTIPTARVFLSLTRPARYKGAWGGRGSGKGYFFADKLIEDAVCAKGDMGEGLRAVCLREIQKDLAQSSKALIESRLRAHNLGEAQGFRVLADRIVLPDDGVMIFRGMRDFTSESIKSLEGFHRAWWDEAQNASELSLQLLRPTMRAKGAELCFSWNPRRKTDAIETMLRGAGLPTDAVVVKALYRDNPWFPEALEQERRDFLRGYPDQYAHVWDGEYVSAINGAYFARELAAARAEKRVTPVHRDPLMALRAFVDIGGTGARADAFAMWIAQFVGGEIHVLDYYEAVGQPLATHVSWLRAKGYGDAQVWLPHDGATHDRVYSVSYESALRDAGFAVEVVPNQGPGAAGARIEAARRLFPRVVLDPKCEPGLEALGWYHEKRDEKREIGLGPDHDWSSHAADAYGLMCVCYEAPKAVKEPRRRQNTSWVR